MLTEVVTGVTVWRVLGVGGEGLGEGRLDVDQLGADDGGAELGVWSLSFRLQQESTAIYFSIHNSLCSLIHECVQITYS